MRGDGTRRSRRAALQQEITSLSPAAMPFMPRQRGGNVSAERGAGGLCPNPVPMERDPAPG